MTGLGSFFRKRLRETKNEQKLPKTGQNPSTHHRYETHNTMTLSLKPPLRYQRRLISQEMSAIRIQLAKALASEDPKRVRTAKIRLIRYLLEVAESPELGPPIPFKLGWRLELAYSMGADPSITLEDLKAASGSYYTLAKLFERSIGIPEMRDYTPLEEAS